NLAAITTRRLPFVDATKVYDNLIAGRVADIGVVLDYPGIPSQTSSASSSVAVRTVSSAALPVRHVSRLSAPATHLDLVGAGNFARTMLLPHLRRRILFGTIVNQTGLSASHVKNKFDFQDAATDPVTLFARGDSSHAVLIATRHHLHASLVTAALATDRHV